MSNGSNTVPGAAIRGTASGVIFMALFGTLWAYTGVMGLQGWGTAWLLIIAVAIGVSLLVGAGALIRASKKLANQGSKSDSGFGKPNKKTFNLIFAAEGVAIFIAVAICNMMNHSELIPILIAIIVGVHFFPLAPLFRVKLYYITGSLLCLLAVGTWLFAPETLTAGDHQILAYMSIVGLGSALILWGTGLAVWLMGKKLLSSAVSQQSGNSFGA
ncbi:MULTISPECIES: hypothetical protein [Bacillales]|uniref:DUF7010 family protein n=1 Tax=Bacillales TaxID=1385 RepID=UPI0006A7ACE8|nr:MULTISPECIES: hypothetical protein [Bacillales]OBZ17598.1 hypothetical protein A7975_07005 [Bacillus sp. FJAT-26390]